MNRLDSQTRAQVISCLIEGCSIRSTVRMTGVAKKTVMRVLVEVGAICAAYQDYAFRNLTTKRLQLDEMWAWIYCKEKNRTEEIAKAHPDAGDVWLWVAVDADTKLVPSWMLGQRDLGTATAFVTDLASRLRHRVQITTDGHRPYLEAVETAFGMEVDYSILQKIYGTPQENETRYSPAHCIGVEMRHVDVRQGRRRRVLVQRVPGEIAHRARADAPLAQAQHANLRECPHEPGRGAREGDQAVGVRHVSRGCPAAETP